MLRVLCGMIYMHMVGESIGVSGMVRVRVTARVGVRAGLGVRARARVRIRVRVELHLARHQGYPLLLFLMQG